MHAKRNENGDYVLTVTPDEAHVLIWGGPTDLAGLLDSWTRSTLVGVEDAMSEAEYGERFGDLDALYSRLRESESLQAYRAEIAAALEEEAV